MNLASPFDSDTQQYWEEAGWQRLVTAVPRWRHEELPGRVPTTEKAIEAQKERETRQKG